MVDPLSEVITLLQPRAVFSRLISGAGRWGVRYSAFGEPSFCAILDGSCRLTVDGHPALTLEAGDFVLLPATPGFTMSSPNPARVERFDPNVTARVLGEIRHGTKGGPPDVRLLSGWFVFDSPDAGLLLSLLPSLVHIRGVERLSVLVRLLGEEASERRSGRDLVLTRLVEVMLIEALRASPADDAPPGLLRGLADGALAPAIRAMHGDITRSWTTIQLARMAALSRSAFFERFTRIVGIAPMAYLLAWRMAVAKTLLRRQGLGVADVAERVGYGSASTFSTAFTRHVGQPPSRYARRETGTNTERRTPNAERRTPNAERRTSNVECRMPNAECRMPNAECRMPNAECRVPTLRAGQVRRLRLIEVEERGWSESVDVEGFERIDA